MMRYLSVLCLTLASAAISGCSSSSTGATQADPSGYEDLCGSGVTCQMGDAPPNLLGIYNGSGTTVVTSNETWAVGSSHDFTATVTSQNRETVAGRFELGDSHLDIKQGNIRGSGDEFTIYGTDSAEENNPDAGGTCSAEARVVVTGKLTTTGSTTSASGKVVLQFTKLQGPGCTQKEITTYPGTGATFTYTATRAP